jgi:hypothetical protein
MQLNSTSLQPPPVSAQTVRKTSWHLRSAWAKCRRGTQGVSTIEFALVLPIFMVLGLYGTEIAHMATVNMQVSQIATSVADNASRLGQTDNSAVTPTVTEADVDSIMNGAIEQGAAIGLEVNGRVILTSLERDSATSKQYIHWQRCTGALDRDSRYGDDGSDNGLTGEALAGLGRDALVRADAGKSVMFVEVYFEYQPLFASFVQQGMVFRQEAAFMTRDDRSILPGVTGAGGTSGC